MVRKEQLQQRGCSPRCLGLCLVHPHPSAAPSAHPESWPLEPPQTWVRSGLWWVRTKFVPVFLSEKQDDNSTHPQDCCIIRPMLTQHLRHSLADGRPRAPGNPAAACISPLPVCPLPMSHFLPGHPHPTLIVT